MEGRRGGDREDGVNSQPVPVEVERLRAVLAAAFLVNERYAQLVQEPEPLLSEIESPILELAFALNRYRRSAKAA